MKRIRNRVMENEVMAGTKDLSLLDAGPKENYINALKKNEAKILSVIEKGGQNLSGEQLYQMSEDYFHDGIDKFIFEDLMGEDHCPLLTFSDAVLEKVWQKPEKFASGKSRFFEAARLGAIEEKYSLRKERIDDIIIKSCTDGKNPLSDISDDRFFMMLDLSEFNASPKSLESCAALLKSAVAKVSAELTPKGFGPFKKKIAASEKEKALSGFEKKASKVFEALSRVVSCCIEKKRTDFYERVSPSSIEELFDFIEDVRKKFGRDENGKKILDISYEEFLLQFINYYVSVAQIKKLGESGSFVPISNWKLNEAFRILGEYSCNPGIQYQLIEKYAKEKNNSMIYFPFEIISDILCKSESGWDINKKCLDVVFEVADERADEKPRIEKLVTLVVSDHSRNDRVRVEAFSRYFDLVKDDLHALVPWIRDCIVPEVFSGKYARASVSVAAKILSLEGTDGADDGLDASRQKCVDYLKDNYESDPLEILNTIKNFLCMRSCRNSVLKEKIYGQFYSGFGDDTAKKIQFNREILDGLKSDESSRLFLCHVCSRTLEMAGSFTDSQKTVLKDSVEYLLSLASSGDESADEVLVKFIYEGKEDFASKDALSKICMMENKVSKNVCFSLIEKICRKNAVPENEHQASVLKTVLDCLLKNENQKSIETDKKLLQFLGMDFSSDEHSLSEYGKKAVNFLWKKSEAKSPLWQEIKFDYIQIVSKCRNVDILQYAFEKACR